MGDLGRPFVVMGNLLSARFALLAMVALVSGVFWMVLWKACWKISKLQKHWQYIYIPLLIHGLPKVEQPASSLLRHSPYYEHLLLNCGPSFLKRTWMGLYGHFSCKPTMLFGNAPGTYWSWAHDILTTTSYLHISHISLYQGGGAIPSWGLWLEISKNTCQRTKSMSSSCLQRGWWKKPYPKPTQTRFGWTLASGDGQWMMGDKWRVMGELWMMADSPMYISPNWCPPFFGPISDSP